METIQDKAMLLLQEQHFDTCAVGRIDFEKRAFSIFEVSAYNIISEKPYLYFDLASMTKTLTNSAIYLKYPEYFSPEMLLLLSHRAGLPMGGRIDRKGWREFLQQYSIKESETLYSDYSSLRCMLEIEKK